jgi:hypothetical protein
MKVILEKALDFKQFQNLIILTFITFMFFLGMVSSLDFRTYYVFEVVLLLLNIIFGSILFTKKGLHIEDGQLYYSIFWFGFILKKTLIPISKFQALSLTEGKLSTNYAYSYDIKEFHNWEPDLNYSVDSFTLFAVDENKTQKQKIVQLTKLKNVTVAIEFIIKNTHLKINQTI